MGIASGQLFARQSLRIVAAPLMALPYQQQVRISEAVRRSSKSCWDFQHSRCSAGGQCRYSHKPIGELDESCLRRGLAELGIFMNLWPGIIRRALEYVTPLISRRRQEEVSRVERRERHCKECNVDFDRDFLEAYALSGRDRQTCARCKRPTAAGSLANWILKSERVQVEITVNSMASRDA